MFFFWISTKAAVDGISSEGYFSSHRTSPVSRRGAKNATEQGARTAPSRFVGNAVHRWRSMFREGEGFLATSGTPLVMCGVLALQAPLRYGLQVRGWCAAGRSARASAVRLGTPTGPADCTVGRRAAQASLCLAGRCLLGWWLPASDCCTDP